MRFMTSKTPFLCLLIVLFAATSSAHLEESIPEGTTSESLHIRGYDITFLRPEGKLAVNRDWQFIIDISDTAGQRAQGIDVQGQILDSKVGKEVFYAVVSEIQPGKYAFTWKPSFAGDYIAQFVFRSAEDEILQPSFAIRIDDPRGRYALVGSIIAGIVSLFVGVYAAWPRRRRKFHATSLLIGIGIAALLVVLGYSVSYFYQAGGERGFVVCGADGCELAVHWHSQLEMSTCGKPVHLPLEAGDLNKQHTHKERDRLHFHALIKTDETGTNLLEPEKLRVGDLFEQLNIRFTRDCFMDYCNGDACPDGKPGTLRMAVNGVPNNEFAEYVWRDGDVIRIVLSHE